jgi:type IV secretory pathway ATPase VirB11/archaellum biosynthesis ATPase
LEQYGDTLVMNTYLKVTILVVAFVCFMLAILAFKSQQALANMHPMIVRINDVGHAEVIYTVDDLIARSTLTRPLADFLADQIRSGKTLLISGGAGTGKTTLLRILADFIPEQDRIVVIEDTSELHIQKPNILRSNARPIRSRPTYLSTTF